MTRKEISFVSEAGKGGSRIHDAFDRVKTYTNADGWTIGYDYYNDGMLKYPDVANERFLIDMLIENG